MFEIPVAIGVQLAPPSADHARSTLETPTLSLAVHVIGCNEPTFQLAAVRRGQVRDRRQHVEARAARVGERVGEAVPAHRVVAPPSHVAEMITWPFETLSQVRIGPTPAPVSVQ